MRYRFFSQALRWFGFMAVALWLCPAPASAAAWTLDTDDVRLLSDVVFSRATRQFGSGVSDFSKLYVKAVRERGYEDGITLFDGWEYAKASWRSNGIEIHSSTAVMETGARLRLRHGDSGVLSLQVSMFSAAGMGTPTGEDDKSRLAEMRLLYGRSFMLSGSKGFVDIQAATRWIDSWVPGEHALDAGIGLWVTSDWMVMVQSFNIIRDGEASYRMNKIELSMVGRLSASWSLRIGLLMTPAGSNAPAEQGAEVSLWMVL